ncbi:MAG TPA: hypothetical protein VFB21_13190 [Chthonomonadaceae bacterium]|nr:hypothetical protein [Chthonomonadaceae bacterium]
MIEGKTREETIRLTAQALGVSELEAEFIVAMEMGEIEGDVEVIKTELTPKSLLKPQGLARKTGV